MLAGGRSRCWKIAKEVRPGSLETGSPAAEEEELEKDAERERGSIGLRRGHKISLF